MTSNNRQGSHLVVRMKAGSQGTLEVDKVEDLVDNEDQAKKLVDELSTASLGVIFRVYQLTGSFKAEIAVKAI